MHTAAAPADPRTAPAPSTGAASSAPPAPPTGRGARAPGRWFLACWPDAAAQRVLRAGQAAWHWSPAARPTAPARLHLTLHFLGPLGDEAVAALRRALDGLAPPPEVAWTLDRPALWPGGVAVLEPSAVPEAAHGLHAALSALLRAQGLAVETRPWRPHVTLARRAGGSTPPAAPPPLHWATRGFDLVCSDHGYHRAARWPSRGSSRASDAETRRP